MSALPVVFLGPSLPPEEARSILEADYRPPVRQGDLMRALADSPPAIAIVDGIFRNRPTARHRECLWVMSRGVPLFGAASMGALRAAELAGQGMIGVGLIYRWYRRFDLLPDDAVALTHGPAELGWQPLNDTLVDIRRRLRAAVRSGVVGPEDAAAMRAAAAGCHFTERRLDRLGTLIGRQELDACLVAQGRSQKAQDAAALLRRLARHVRRGDWPRPDTAEPALVDAWVNDLRDAGFVVEPDVEGCGRTRIRWP